MSGEAKSKKRFAKGKGKKEEHAENGDNGISVSAGNILTQLGDMLNVAGEQNVTDGIIHYLLASEQ